MRPLDYQVWMAVRAVGEAVTKTKLTAPAELKTAYARRRISHLPAYKGVPLSFRPWDQQLRQPILIAQPNSLVSVAPERGFLHQRTPLDTLGIDQPETAMQTPLNGGLSRPGASPLLIATSSLAASFAAAPAQAYMVYVSNEKDNSVSVIDSDTLQVKQTVKVGRRPRGITISPDGKYALRLRERRQRRRGHRHGDDEGAALAEVRTRSGAVHPAIPPGTRSTSRTRTTTRSRCWTSKRTRSSRRFRSASSRRAWASAPTARCS